MANNAVGVSAAGEGSRAITGYTVSGIQYNNQSGTVSGSGCGALDGCYVKYVHFTLTSKAPSGSTAYTEAPDFIYAAVFNSADSNIANADGDCALESSGWVDGSGTYDCLLNPESSPPGTSSGIPMDLISYLDVAANQ